jgi:hypothetical protein
MGNRISQFTQGEQYHEPQLWETACLLVECHLKNLDLTIDDSGFVRAFIKEDNDLDEQQVNLLVKNVEQVQERGL